jgi:hypothetical protein
VRQNANLDESADSRRQFLYQAITNAQTVIGSVENRVPMALVLHGLIFAGLVSIASDLGAPWHHVWWRWALAVELLLALIAFMISIWAFIVCVSPPGGRLGPQEIPGVDYGAPVPGLPPGELFFLSPELKIRRRKRMWNWGPRLEGEANGIASGPLRFDDLLEAHQTMSAALIEQALSAQLLRISMYRATKSVWARLGFRSLLVEIVFGVAVILTLGVYALAHA